jgi:hypothetical protein
MKKMEPEASPCRNQIKGKSLDPDRNQMQNGLNIRSKMNLNGNDLV